MHRTLTTVLLLLVLLGLGNSKIWAISEISGSEGAMTADYAEEADSQSAQLSGNNRVLAYRSTKAISFLDL
ncbi:MAG: hypothetical protein RL242_2800, partial [Pseudomonadota bacterium]